MAFTQADADTLRAAVAEGIHEVRYSDRTVTYNSLAEMRAALSMIEAELAAAAGEPRPRVYYGSGSKGLD